MSTASRVAELEAEVRALRSELAARAQPEREGALRESEDKLRLALTATGIALWSWSPGTGVVEWDARMCEILGRDEPLDFPAYLQHAVHPDDREMVARANRRGGAGPGPWEMVIHRIVRPDGAIRWVLARGLNVTGEGGETVRVLGVTLDMTDQRRLEEQLRHAQRLDALGHLTAGVAHNFNNLLMIITSTLELIARRGAGNSAELVEEARQAANRAAEMVRQLMTFAGQQARTDRSAHAIGPLVQHAVELCRRTFDRHIVLECEIDEDLPPVLCSEGELEQVLMNLLLNARDAVLASACPEPHIRIRVDRTKPRRSAVASMVRVEVRDDGIGMSEEVLGQAFDPFFTTKPPGQGTGLGLATSYAIVRELGGSLTGSAKPGTGASFVVHLPSSDAAAAPPARPSPTPAAPQPGRVLIVDDEAPIRRAVAAVLEDVGFAVEGVASGEEALLRMEGGLPFDVVLLDRSMPGAPGETFLERMRALAPASRILLFSGQAVDSVLAARVDGVLIKPASSNELVTAISALVAPR